MWQAEAREEKILIYYPSNVHLYARMLFLARFQFENLWSSGCQVYLFDPTGGVA